MAVYDFFLSRNNGPTANTYVGHAGRLFYDNAERVLRISNGVTPGGEIFNGYVSVSETEPAQPFQGQVWLNPDTSELGIYHNGNFIPSINAATDVKLGGIKLGPGVITNSEGQIIIDSTGLDFSFGDFQALIGFYSDSTQYALLSIINPDEDIVLASNGDGDIKVVGGFEVYATNGNVTGSLEEEPFFRILEDGQVRILVPLADTTEGGMEIIGSDLGTSLQPGLAGVMLHLTGNADLPTRVYHDTLSDYSSYVFRRYNGSVVTPTQVLADEDIGRINWTAATNAGMGNVSTAQIRVAALENQTTTAQGSKITFIVTPVGSAAAARVDALVVKATGIELPVGGSTVKLSGSTSGSITVQATAIAGTNVITLPAATGTLITTGDTETVTNTMLAGSIANNKLSFSSVTVNGTSIALGASGTVTAAAGTLTGTTLNSTVVSSSLTSVGTLTSLSVANGISDGIGDVRSIPLNSQGGAYNLAATDNGKMISITTGGVSVLQNVFASPYGQIISIFNNSNASQTITQGAGVTLRLAGTAATGNRTLARYGVATITCVAANTFVISGAGLT